MLYSNEQIERANSQSITEFFAVWAIPPITKAAKCTYTDLAA